MEGGSSVRSKCIRDITVYVPVLGNAVKVEIKIRNSIEAISLTQAIPEPI